MPAPPATDLSARLPAALTPARLALLRDLGRLASARGASAWLVGGAARDVLLGVPAGDLDVVFEGPAPAIGRALAARLGGSLLVHEAFGTAVWTAGDGEVVDLVTARSEVYPTPAALPVVRPAGLAEDLARRDFSLNAMAIALDPARWGALEDPHGGRADLEARVLRVLHARSFVEDPCRAWRAARFAGRLGCRLGPETARWLAAARDGGALARLGPERLGKELEHLLAEAAVVHAFERLADWQLAGLIHPALAGSWLARRLETSLAAGDREALWLVLAERLSPAERTALARLVPGGGLRRRRWLQSRERIEAASAGLAEIAEIAASAPLGRGRGAAIGAALAGLDAVELAYLQGRLDDSAPLDWWGRTGLALRPVIGGRELIARGLPQGPGLGRALAAAQRVAWDGGDEAAQLRACLEASKEPAP